MVNELRHLLHENVLDAPHDPSDLAEVVRRGRGQVRRRRAGVVVGAAAAVAGVVALGVVLPRPDGSGSGAADRASAPIGPVLRLEDARTAVAGRDLTVLASHTNRNLDQENGQYFDGVTADGLVVFRDGPHGVDNLSRFALMDPETGERTWLPLPPGQVEWPVELGRDRLVFLSAFGLEQAPSVLVFDRATQTWRTVSWPGLPAKEWRSRVQVGPDGRAYVGFSSRVDRAVETAPLEDEAPAGSTEELDDSNAPGETLDLWSASLTDPSDVHDEVQDVGDFAFTEDEMVWTDITNGVNDRVHVRDLVTGEETSFDPRSGDRCNQLGLSVSRDMVVMSQYCGETDGVRDDRIQVVSLTGEPVVTIQDDGLSGWVAADGLVELDAYAEEDGGAYAYELSSGRFLRLSTASSKFAMGGPLTAGLVLWDEPVNNRHGARQNLARLH